MLFELLLSLMCEALRIVLGFDQIATLLVLFGVGFRILHHGFNVRIIEPAIGLDGDLLLFASRLVFGADRDDAIGVDVEGYIDLRHAARRGRNVLKIELTEVLVIGGHFALTLEHPDGHCRLIVLGS